MWIFFETQMLFSMTKATRALPVRVLTSLSVSSLPVRHTSQVDKGLDLSDGVFTHYDWSLSSGVDLH